MQSRCEMCSCMACSLGLCCRVHGRSEGVGLPRQGEPIPQPAAGWEVGCVTYLSAAVLSRTKSSNQESGPSAVILHTAYKGCVYI
jgi:hypothetical protein